MTPTILLFMPAKDEAASIAKVITEARDVIRNNLKLEPTVLIIDDGSRDDTAKEAARVGAHVLRHETNEGLGTTFKEAVAYSVTHKFDLLLTMDADGQFAANDIPALCEPILSGTALMTTGSRFMNGAVVNGIPKVKLWGNYLMTSMINSIVGHRYYDVSCGFRVYSREALLRLNLFGKFTYTQEVFLNLSSKGMKIKEIPITVQYFVGRRSRIAGSLIRYARETLKIIFKAVLYYRPLRLFGNITALLWILSLPVVLILGVRYALTDLITPFKGIAVVSLVLASLGFASLATGILLQIITRLQATADDILYYVKQR